MLWINFLHFYQPATADAHTIKEATEKSYTRIISALKKHSNIKFTLNINGSLVERWEELGYSDLIKDIKILVKKGQIELTGTAYYHPILPLIPKEEAIRQIKAQEEILKKCFGENLPLGGFFLPEMAYNERIGRIIKNLGYKWIIIGELSYNGKLGTINFEKIYQDKTNELKAIFRSRELSRTYVPGRLLEIIKYNKNKEKVFISATDGELYGLKHNDPEKEFEKLLSFKKIKTETISSFINKQKGVVKTNLISACWESTEEELKNKMPYALWYNKNNKIQIKLWELSKFAYSIIKKHPKDKNYYWARWHFSRGLASCTFWWASARDFSNVFGPIAWGPDEIEKGLSELIRSIRTLDNATTRKTKLKAEKLYTKIKHMIWSKHWSYYWKRD